MAHLHTALRMPAINLRPAAHQCVGLPSIGDALSSPRRMRYIVISSMIELHSHLITEFFLLFLDGLRLRTEKRRSGKAFKFLLRDEYHFRGHMNGPMKSTKQAGIGQRFHRSTFRRHRSRNASKFSYNRICERFLFSQSFFGSTNKALG